MLTNTLIFINAFLSKTDFQENYFQEKDFKINNHDYKGQYMIATKNQWITYKGYTFRVYIYCEIETQLDELSKIQFSCNDINDNNKKKVLEYLANISILFSSFLSFSLYISLDNEFIYQFYEKAQYELNEKNFNDKYEGVGTIYFLSPSNFIELKYRTFLGLFVNDSNEIIISFSIDIYNQHHNN